VHVSDDFIQAEHGPLLDRLLGEIDLPSGFALRGVDFLPDLRAIAEAEMDPGDRIHPCYGMAPADSAGEVTLILTQDGRPVGQVSAELTARIGEDQVQVEIGLAGIFLAASARGRGMGHILGEALRDVAAGWAEGIAARHGNIPIHLDLSADTEPDTAGAAVVMALESRLDVGPDPACEEFST